jgi:hypothetical protein
MSVNKKSQVPRSQGRIGNGRPGPSGQNGGREGGLGNSQRATRCWLLPTSTATTVRWCFGGDWGDGYDAQGVVVR